MARHEPDFGVVGESRYRAVFAALDEGFALCELIRSESGQAVDYRILDANAATELILGIPPEQAIGRTVRELVPEIEDEWIATCARAGLGGESLRVEQYMPWFDRWIEVFLVPSGRSGDGHFAAVYNDRSDQKRAEVALRRSEERQVFLLGLSDALRPLVDPVSVQEAASELVGEYLGVARAAYGDVELDGETMTVVRDWHRPNVSSTVGRFAIDELGTSFIDRVRAGEVATIEDASTARTFPAETSAKTWGSLGVRSAIVCPIVKHGQFVAAFFIQHDEPRRWSADEVALMTEVADRTWEAVERARTEQALRESEQRLRKVLEIETIGIVFFESNGVISDANDAFLRLGGYTRHDLVDRTLRIEALTPSEWREATGRALDELRRFGRSTPYEKECLCRDGSRWPVLVAATMLDERHGVEFVLDLTALHRAERAALAEWERRDQLEREFVANAAHELRTPLTAIIASVEALDAGARELPDLRDRFFEHIKEEAVRLNRLTESLLLLARIESVPEVPRSVVELRPLLEELAARLHPPAGVEVRLDVPRTMTCWTNAGLVERVVENLAINAVKHTERGQIELRASETATALFIEVADTGFGITSEIREHAFERFYRGGARRNDGFGLGLAIAAKAASALGGELTVKPRSGGGTVARLSLPIENG